MYWLPTVVMSVSLIVLRKILRRWNAVFAKALVESAPPTPHPVRFDPAFWRLVDGVISLFVGLPVWVATGAGYWILRCWAMDQQMRAAQDVVYLIGPSLLWFFVPSFLVGFAVGTCAVSLVWWLIYLLHKNRAALLRHLGTGTPMSATFLLVSLLAFISDVSVTLASRSFITVTPQSVRIGRIFSSDAAAYDFGDVKAIWNDSMTVQHRVIPAFTIKFSDQSTWCSQGMIKDVNPDNIAEHKALVEYVSARSGVPIRPRN